MRFPRLFTDQLNQAKATQVLHRIADQAFATPSLIYSVLYHADRECLSRIGNALYGETYLAYHHAAVPSWANHVYMTLCMPSRDVALYLELRRLFLVNGEGWLINRDMSVRGDRGLSDAEREIIDSAVYWYRSATHNEIIFSRRDASWQQTAQGSTIPESVLRRNGRPSPLVKDGVPPPKPIAYLNGGSPLREFAADEPELSGAMI